MKRWSVSVALLCLLACRNPNSYQPFDPTMPDPPGPPELLYPFNGWISDSFVYPQNVNFGWRALAGAQFYQFEIYRDSLLSSQSLNYSNWRVSETSLTVSEATNGPYYWRVRAASIRWNDYTDWSSPFFFGLRNPMQ